jgi:hypothetical protein
MNERSEANSAFRLSSRRSLLTFRLVMHLLCVLRWCVSWECTFLRTGARASCRYLFHYILSGGSYCELDGGSNKYSNVLGSTFCLLKRYLMYHMFYAIASYFL